jgi:peptide/nickel transport system substrate-binding protein
MPKLSFISRCLTSIALAAATVGLVSSSSLAEERKITVGQTFFTKDQVKFEVGKYGGRLVRDALGDPKSFNPITAGETSTTDYTVRIFQGLTRIDWWSGEIIPLLAERWEVAEDGLTWTFYLRKDVTFNNGTPFTADDVVFSYNDGVFDRTRPNPETTDPRWPCSARDSLTFEGKSPVFSKVDDYTVKVVTPVKVAILPRLLAEENIISKAAYESAVKDGSLGSKMSTDSKPEEIVGTGPWMLGSYTRGNNVTLKRNPNYWMKDAAGNKLPYLDEQVWQLAGNLNQLLLNFRQGITDIYALQGGKDVPELRPLQEKENFSIWQLGPDHGTTFVCFNMNLDAAKKGKVEEYKVNWFRDRRFRQAVSYAIDRDAMVKNIHRNLGYPQAAPYTRAPGPFKVSGIEPYPLDREKAKALLDEMGLKDRDGNGIREDEQGREVSFTLNTNSGNTTRENQCDFIRKDLEQVGIKVNILFLEFNLLIDKIDVSYDFEAIVMGFTGSQEPHEGANLWLSTGRAHMWWPEQKTPSTEWEKRIDQIFIQAIQEFDLAKRQALYREWIELVHLEQPKVFLTNIERVSALRNRFGNVFPSPAPQYAVLQYEEHLYVK